MSPFTGSTRGEDGWNKAADEVYNPDLKSALDYISDKFAPAIQEYGSNLTKTLSQLASDPTNTALMGQFQVDNGNSVTAVNMRATGVKSQQDLIDKLANKIA